MTAQPVRYLDSAYQARRQFLPLMRETSAAYGLPPRKERWAIAVCHRRAGKTVACINELILSAVLCTKKNPRFAYIAPFFSQAKDVAWSYLKQYSQVIPNIKINESELFVDYPNGGRIRLYGADNWERLRGLYFDGVVCDEFGDMHPSAWETSIRPALSDREGWAIFIGTPRGDNHFHTMFKAAKLPNSGWFTLRLPASETGIMPQKELDDNRSQMSPEQYASEFECSFEASVMGSYWGREMEAADKAGRICSVPYQPEAGVSTWWDLGVSDSTVIWLTQDIGREIHVIGCIEGSGEGLRWYVSQPHDLNYTYVSHNGPHDLAVRELGSGKSRIETAASLGINFKTVPNIPRQDGIEAARSIIARCWFDQERTQRGRSALVAYQRTWDDKRKVFSTNPLHNWASDWADAWRYFAVGHKTSGPKPTFTASRPRSSGGGDHGWMGM
jgi:phage terminase large subunit